MLTIHLFIFENTSPGNYTAMRMVTRGRKKPDVDALRPKAIPADAKIILRVFARGDPIKAFHRVDERALQAAKKRRITRVRGLHTSK